MKQLKLQFSCAGIAVSLLLVSASPCVRAQEFIHPGGLFKQSDMDRMRAMVAAGVQPWTASFNQLQADAKAGFNYVVRGDPGWTSVGRDGGPHRTEFESDVTAAYLNALMWIVTQDSRHADKCVEIFNTWKNLTNMQGGGTESLNGGLYAWKLVEAAEIIKSTYSGWASADLQQFKDMLVYPGYSTNGVPASVNSTNGTFYWRIYKGDPGRHGNQDLIAWRAMIVMGVFLDNRTMYDRALRYFKGLPGRPDDIPMPTGPSPSGSIVTDNQYFTAYQYLGSQGTISNYGYNGVLTNYVWENGQNQESSRDQQHAFFGLGICAGIAEVAWNQGDDVWNAAGNRLLLGFEFMARYNTSYIQSFPDQPTPWEPTNFIQRTERTGRWFSKSINPYFESNFTNVSRGEFATYRPVYEQAVAHFQIRMGLTNESVWTERSRDVAIALAGYERTGWSLDHPGWGALTFRRPALAAGDPISGFTNGLPVFDLHLLPGTVRAANYDYFPANGEGRTYHDLSPENVEGAYRTNAVDIENDPLEGPCLMDLEDGEWTTYTVNVPGSMACDISVRYAATNSGGTIQFAFGGTNVTSEVALPDTGGWTNWTEHTVVTNVVLEAGVQAMRVFVGGTSRAFKLNEIRVSQTGVLPVPPGASIWTNILNGDASGSWGTAANWLSGSIPDGSDDVADFSSLDISTLSTVTLDGSRSVGQLIFGDTAPSSSWTLNSGSGGSLTLAVKSNTPAIHVYNPLAVVNCAILGTQGVTKLGLGTVTLNNTGNTYSGDTLIEAGTVRLGVSGNPLGADTAEGANRVTIKSGATLQLNPNVQVFTKELHLSGEGVGGAQGALYVDATGTGNGTRWAHSGLVNPAVALDTNATIRVDGDGGGASSSDVLVGYTHLNGHTLCKTGAGRLSFDRPGTSAIVGPGTVHVAEGVVGFVENQIYDGIHVEVDAGGLIRGGRNPGPFRSSGNSLTLNGTWIVNGRGNGVAGSDSTSNSELVGLLNGSGVITTGTFGNTNLQTITIRNDGTDSSFSGTITEDDGHIALVKSGLSVLTLSGSNSYHGTTVINSGTLRVNGTHNGGDAYTVNAGGVLGGSGVIASPVTVAASAVLAPGVGLGTLTLESHLTLVGNVHVEVDKTNPVTNDFCNVAGNLVNIGTGSVVVSNLGPALAAGDVFKLFNKPMSNGGSLAILPEPGPALYWMNRLAIDGTIAVMSSAANYATNIAYAIAGDSLTLTWPASHLGWLVQSNGGSLSNASDWVTLAGSDVTNSYVASIAKAQSNAFFRITRP